METKRPYIRVWACRHVAAPDHLEAGCRNLPLDRGPATIQGVPDPKGGPGSGIPWGSGPLWKVRSFKKYLVFEFLDTDLKKYLDVYRRGPNPRPLPPHQVKVTN